MSKITEKEDINMQKIEKALQSLLSNDDPQSALRTFLESDDLSTDEKIETIRLLIACLVKSATGRKGLTSIPTRKNVIKTFKPVLLLREDRDFE